MDSTAPKAQPEIMPPEGDEHTRHRLLRCAVQIFDRKGYAAASVREIAELAGVAKPALYYHFGSKEGLLVAILEAASSEFADAMTLAVQRTGSARQRLVALCEDVHGLFEKNVPVARVAHSVFLGPSDSVPNFDLCVFERSLRAAIEGIVGDGQEAGEFLPARPADVAMAIMGIIEGSAGRQFHLGLEAVGIDGLRRTLDIVFDGVLTERRVQGEHTR